MAGLVSLLVPLLVKPVIASHRSFRGSRPGKAAFAVALLAAVLLSGCASPLSRATLAQVSPGLTLAAVVDHPKSFVGETIVVAGPVLAVTHLPEGTLLEILAYPTTRRDTPDLSEPAAGRFFLLHPGYLDALIYRQGRQVAAAGRIIGEKSARTGQITRQIPLLRPLEIQLLEEPRTYPPFSFNFGLQFGF